MNTSREEAQQLASEIVHMAQDELNNDALLIMCVPFIHIPPIASLIGSSTKSVYLGAQNCHQAEKGAFTGEIPAGMLKDYGVSYVIIGHSERREYFGEDNTLLAAKTDAVLKQGLQPIFCCGEVLEERKAGRQNEVVETQLKEGLFHLSAEQLQQVVIAYEPVWAIGTGETATPDQAQDMHAFIRNLIATTYDVQVADAISILYGGSMKPANAKDLMAKPDVDGGLIGGASLQSRSFVDIAKSF